MTSIEMIWIGELADSPIGSIWIATSTDGLVAIDLWHDRERMINRLKKDSAIEIVHDPEQVEDTAVQLTEYFAQTRKTFSLPINWSVMTPFQREALQVVARIEYGRTRTYGDIARELGKAKAVRAVGRANATNPLPIIIPCHRVLGSDGRLHGYSAPGGLETKAYLLRMEGSWLL